MLCSEGKFVYGTCYHCILVLCSPGTLAGDEDVELDTGSGILPLVNEVT